MTQPGAGSILIVDDSPELRDVLSRTLSDLPYTVITAASVESAKLALEQLERIHLIVVDLSLPDGSGFEIVRSARKVRPEIRILAMSGYDVANTDVEVLLKPFDTDEFVARVEALLSKELAE